MSWALTGGVGAIVYRHIKNCLKSCVVKEYNYASDKRKQVVSAV